MSMFCYQCEQTFRGTGCVSAGVCGKDPASAALQDLIVHAVKGLSQVAHRARGAGLNDPEVDRFTLEALFATVTNVNFDPPRLADLARRAAALRDTLMQRLREAGGLADAFSPPLTGAAKWQPAATLDALVDQGREVAIPTRLERLGPDVVSLHEICTYGIKGLAAYAYHAEVLGVSDPAVPAAIHETLTALTEPRTVEELTALCLRVGEINLKAMELLDRANTETYGHPEPTAVRITPRKGKAIVVSGHDLKDLELLLEQTEGKGINVYTHGELLPAHAYPRLKRFSHLAGNYGGAWMLQRKEFSELPGAVLMTTNCIQRPADSYTGRIFTSGPVAWPGVVHIADHDFTPVIEAALAADGFAEDGPDETITVGFGRQAVLGVADQVIQAVKEGAIKHFYLIGGCDGAHPSRNIYTDMAQKVPDDCVILTLACGKYRFNKLPFGDIGGIPRLLDVGQCNDAYSAIVIAGALAEAFGTDVNGLPLTLVLSWYEQKAVAILLTLLHLGIRNIRIGPSLPAFISPAVLDVLTSTFNLMPITSVDQALGLAAEPTR